MKKTLIPLISMLGLLILAALGDLLYVRMAQQAGQAFDWVPLTWLKIGLTLTFAAAVLGFVWVSLIYTERSIAVSAIFMAVGLFTLASLTIQVSMFWSDVLGIARIRQILLVLTVSSLSLTSMAGAFVALTGLIGLIPLGRKIH